MSIKVNFIIGQLSNEELESLKNGHSIISKMIITQDDFNLFHYKENELIQVETGDGNRLWSKINHMEIVKDEERAIIIFTLTKA